MRLDWLEGPLPDVEEIRRRVEILVPEQIDSRGFVRREIGAKTIFVLLYGLAVEGTDTWIRPTAVTDMTDAQAAQHHPDTRRTWLRTVQSSKRPREISGRWYGENTRESIRDETLRTMVELGLAVEREGLPTTSPKPRYALAGPFAVLFDPNLSLVELPTLGRSWREQHLSAAAIARRREELEALARAGGLESGNCAFVTAFRDRADSPFRSMASSFAWRSFAWFESEPDQIMVFRKSEKGHLQKLSALLR